MSIPRDTKDWTWVLERPCRECGFDPARYPTESFVPTLHHCADQWNDVVSHEGARVRARDDRWSTLEYGCHVRDVCRVMDGRLASILAEDNPVFPNWDQDETALAEQYGRQDPTLVGAQVKAAASQFTQRIETIDTTMWSRPGTRSNGSRFSAETLVRYAVHDIIHHLWDVANDDYLVL